MIQAQTSFAPGNINSAKNDLLPQLREDLELVQAPRLDDGSPSWTIIDPIRQKYYRIGWQEFEILSRWHLEDASGIVEAVNLHTTLKITPQQVEEVTLFLKSHNLIKTVESEHLFSQHQRLNKQNLMGSLLKNYLFLKIPLWRPDSFLSATMPFARLFFSPLFWGVIVSVGLFASYLTLRQFDTFRETFIYFFSLEGLVYYSIALTLTKIIHEFGHAYTAKKYGLHIPTMGIAFILLWPILYTDTTDAWRLASRKQRLQIGCAGMLMEIYTAVIATLLWNFLPEGPVKSAVFFVATTTWLVTLTVNLNPFMRFDGYYILSDLLDVPNLQSQAFALAKWRLRKMLFGFKDICPVNMPVAKKRLMLIYAYSTWIYRFVLFLGIAILVYHFTFKILGIFLMAVEITLFITMPVARELMTWWHRRKEAGLNVHVIFTFCLLGSLICLSFVPWPTIIQIPATYETQSYIEIYPPQNGQLMKLNAFHDDLKEKGELLFTIHSPRLSYQAEQAQKEVDVLKLKLKKVIASSDSEEEIQIVQEELAAKLTSLKGYQTQVSQLKVIAPKSGRLIISEAIAPKTWVNQEKALMALVDEENLKAEGYIHEKYLRFIRSGDSGLFYDELSEVSPFEIEIESIDHVDTRHLPKPYLASEFGGEIPVELSNKGELTTHAGYYKVVMKPTGGMTFYPHVIRGYARFEGKPQNIYQRIWPQIAAVFIRESGF